jgi:AcrR family transcriptional regulator
MNKTRSRGRPSGASTAKADILDAARRRFSEVGYAKASLRSIAADAGVDAALISYHFGSKRGLFGAALELSVNPTVVIGPVLDAPVQVLPERLLRAVLTIWDDELHRAPLLRMVEGALSHSEVGLVLRDLVQTELVPQIAERLGEGTATRATEHRAAATAAMVGGLIIMRYVLRVEPIATMAVDDVLAAYGPGLRAAMLGGVPARSTNRSR